jgi:hypothetical protein
VDDSFQDQFCAIEYRTQRRSEAAPIILLVVEYLNGSIRFLVHPEWRAIVQAEDLDYIESLLRDFAERAEQDRQTLFKQLSFLGVGPLVTQVTGKRVADHPALSELCSSFVQI